MAQKKSSPKTVRMEFPFKGIHQGAAFTQQPAGTCVDALNMRTFDPLTGRATGAVRPGVSKYNTETVDGDSRVQDINHAVRFLDGTKEHGSISLREIVPLAVSNGKIRKFDATEFTDIEGGGDALTAPLDKDAPFVMSARFYDDVFYVDGSNCVYFDSDANSGDGEIVEWTATAGSIPCDGSNFPRLIETWRGRIVLSGITTDPHNYFMSRVDDPTDFDYLPTSLSASQAVAGNAGNASLVADKINTIIPYSDDLLLFGCDHSIWRMTGDPMEGGRLDLVNGTIGMAWGRPWCMGASGEVYFVGSRGGIYRIMPTTLGQGSIPERISALKIENFTHGLDMDTTLFRMTWNDEEMGVNVFVSSLSGNERTHLFYDVRADAWWVDRFCSFGISPIAVHVLDGDLPSDRAILLGGEDGYIRKLDHECYTDDGEAINSSVVLGPFYDREGTDFVVSELWGETSNDSANVSVGVMASDSAQTAMTGTQKELDGFLMADGEAILLDVSAGYTATLRPPVSCTFHPRVRGSIVYFTLSAVGRWVLGHVSISVVPSAYGRPGRRR